jgi:hypothetical protein
MLSLKDKLAKNYVNARGWSTKEKYLIIESDDWGAIRMPSKEAYNKFLLQNIKVNESSFDKYDSLETVEDLKALFATLSKFSDKKGNPAVLTAYQVVANPDFDKIKKSGMKEYFFETVDETYSKNKDSKGALELIKFGIEKGLYIPQSHGREHINVKRWMEAINSNSEKERFAFELQAIISSDDPVSENNYTKNYFAGQDYSDLTDIEEIEKITSEGLQIFEDLFGFKSLSFTPQGSFWGDHLLKPLYEGGVLLIGGRQFHPIINGKHKFINNNYWGSKNNVGQVHWRRNVLFEPVRNQKDYWVEKALCEIEIAFRWGKPAVLSTHRNNFTGSIFEENREQSLIKLERLIEKVLEKYPDVRFISTQELSNIMLSKINI